MPPHTAARQNKTGWSQQQEWSSARSANSYDFRGYWISLHTLFFSIIGAGLSNPFSVCSKKDLELFKSDRQHLGNESSKYASNCFCVNLYDSFPKCCLSDLNNSKSFLLQTLNGLDNPAPMILKNNVCKDIQY